MYIPISLLSSGSISSTFCLCALVATSKWPLVIGIISKKAITLSLFNTKKHSGANLVGSAASVVGMHARRSSVFDAVGVGYAFAMLQNGQV